MGLVTLEDILEVIVGDIIDEKDVEVSGVQPEADGSFLVEGRVTVRDLNRQLDWSLPDDEATTVAGLLIHEARRIPEVGDSFQFHGFRFEVVRRQRHQLTLLRIRPQAEEAPAVA
jgi:Mg2+/Co2+ transporter CorB